MLPGAPGYGPVTANSQAFMTQAPLRSMSPSSQTQDAETRWQRYCELLWHHPSLGFWLDCSRMPLDRALLATLEPRFQQAFTAMQELEAGAIANPDEGRMVGHYWLRAPELAPGDAIANGIRDEIQRQKSFAAQVLSGSLLTPTGGVFTDVVWIGIGGSGLGPLLIINALQQPNCGLHFHFLDNVDPEGMRRLFDQLGERMRTALVVVVSKSGGTPEPHIGMVETRHRLELMGGVWHRQAVAVTMVGSKLDRQADQEAWLRRFDLADWIGGRTSITSAVGLLPALLARIDIDAFLAGAAAMDVATRIPRVSDNPAALMAASWYVAGDGAGKRDLVMLPYRDRLETFSRYLQQLIMESLGKRLDRRGVTVNQGLAVYGNKGSTDQHAYVQQLRDGIDNFFVTFIESLEDPDDIPNLEESGPGDFLAGFLQGTRDALTESGRQCLSITLTKLDARALGALIALFERTVSLYAELIDINAYHQPGVEAGKQAAAAVLELQHRIERLLADGQCRTAAETARELGQPSQVERTFRLLRHMSFNRCGVVSEGNWAEPAGVRFHRTRD